MKVSTMVIVILFHVVVICGCKRSHIKSEELVKEFMGQQIVIPDSLRWQIRDTNIVIENEMSAFTIITYIDSGGCTPCNMKLRQWESLLSKIKSNPDINIEFRMIVNSRNRKRIERFLMQESSNLPVTIDSIDSFRKLNALLSDKTLQTILLDTDNKVIAIGDPVSNPKVRRLYQKRLTFGREMDSIPTVVYSVGIVEAGKSFRLSSHLVNSDTLMLNVSEIVPSSRRVLAQISDSLIPYGKMANVEIKLVTDSTIASFTEYIDIFFNERQKPYRIMFYGYIYKPYNH